MRGAMRDSDAASRISLPGKRPVSSRQKLPVAVSGGGLFTRIVGFRRQRRDDHVRRSFAPGRKNIRRHVACFSDPLPCPALSLSLSTTSMRALLVSVLSCQVPIGWRLSHRSLMAAVGIVMPYRASPIFGLALMAKESFSIELSNVNHTRPSWSRANKHQFFY